MRTRTHTHRGETKWAHGHKAAPSKPRREASDGTPWPWTSGLQNCETMPVFRVSRPGQPVALWFGGPGRLMPLTLSVSSPPILNIASFFYHLRFTVFPNSHLFFFFFCSMELLSIPSFVTLYLSFKRGSLTLFPDDGRGLGRREREREGILCLGLLRGPVPQSSQVCVVCKGL